MAAKIVKKILFFGLGAIGQRHLRIIKSLVPKAEIFAFRKRGRELIIRDDLTAVKGNLARYYDFKPISRLKDAVKLRPNLVFVTNPSSLHLSTAREFMRDGVHLLIEKPLGHNLREAEKFLQESRRTKNAILVGYQLHYHPLFREVKKLLQTKIIGKLCSVNIAVGYYAPIFHRYESYRDSYLARKDQGGGVILTQSHEINSIIELFGVPKSLFALGGKKSTLQIDVEDTVDVLCDYKDFNLTLHMDYLQYEPQRSYKFIGDKAAIDLDLTANSLTIVKTSGKTKKKVLRNFQRNQMYRAQQKDLLRQIEKRNFDRTNLENAVAVLEFAAAIKKSIRDRKAVAL